MDIALIINLCVSALTLILQAYQTNRYFRSDCCGTPCSCSSTDDNPA